jgi:lysophospholipase L1-like esterase
MSSFNIDQPQTFYQELGLITVVSSGDNSLTLQANQTTKFPSNEYLYSLNFSGITFWFRYNTVAFDGTNTNFTQVQWYNNLSPGIISFTNADFELWVSERKSLYGRKLCTIGDSITWQGFGSYLRTLLRDDGLQYDFVGQYIDTFGFRHAGHGGDTTANTLASINLIPTCDSYTILLGTNDYGGNISETQTITNLQDILYALQGRNINAKLNLCTLLARHDIPQHSIDVNNLIKSSAWPGNTNVIDLWTLIPELGSSPNYANYYVPDQIHPNLAGYQLIAPLLSAQII